MKILHELTAISREESSVFVILNAQQEGEKMIDNTLAEGLEIFSLHTKADNIVQCVTFPLWIIRI